MLLAKVIDEATGYSRVDVVLDVYDPQAIKSDERTKRGSQKMCNIRILNRARLTCQPATRPTGRAKRGPEGRLTPFVHV